MPAPDHSVFTGRMPFLPPNQQRQSTEGINDKQYRQIISWHTYDMQISILAATIMHTNLQYDTTLDA